MSKNKNTISTTDPDALISEVVHSVDRTGDRSYHTVRSNDGTKFAIGDTRNKALVKFCMAHKCMSKLIVREDIYQIFDPVNDVAKLAERDAIEAHQPLSKVFLVIHDDGWVCAGRNRLGYSVSDVMEKDEEAAIREFVKKNICNPKIKVHRDYVGEFSHENGYSNAKKPAKPKSTWERIRYVLVGATPWAGMIGGLLTATFVTLSLTTPSPFHSPTTQPIAK